MAPPIPPEAQGSSTRPYLIRALHDWCTDNGFTPYIAVHVDASVQVPMEYVKNHEIVLNVGFDATNGLRLGNDFVEFKARFGGVARDIIVPVDHVIAIYARENGQGMAFPVPAETPADPSDAEAGAEPAAGTCLRLATRPDAEAGSEVAMPTEAADGDGVGRGGGGEEPPPPPSGGGARPSLKRVK